MRRWLNRHEFGVEDRGASLDWTLCEICDSPLRFDDEFIALRWLRGFDLGELRVEVDKLGPALRVAQTDHDRLLELLANWLVRRRLYACAVRVPVPLPGGGGGGLPPAPLPQPKPQPRPVATHWVEIFLTDNDDQPVPGEAYRVELPNGDVRTGSLDRDGRAYIANIEQAGACKVTFPAIDANEWAPLGRA
ncbi:hypothetical protein BH09PSE6_BH09PSE6_31950 [soil metagenome]